MGKFAIPETDPKASYQLYNFAVRSGRNHQSVFQGPETCGTFKESS
jgi:hypothetical protein